MGLDLCDLITFDNIPTPWVGPLGECVWFFCDLIPFDNIPAAWAGPLGERVWVFCDLLNGRLIGSLNGRLIRTA